MWWFSLRFGKHQRIAAAAVVIAVTAVLCGKISGRTTVFEARTVSAAVQAAEISGADMTERTDFLAECGILTHGEVMDTVTVPKPFDAVYEDYNALQQTQGFDLQRYRGKEVQRYRYPVTGDFGEGVATLLVYRDRIIGGDLSMGGERYALSAADSDG